MISNISYRLSAAIDRDFLKEMLYLALFVPPGQPPFPKAIIDTPEIAKYIADWGTKVGDIAIVATDRDQPIGAIWGRLFNNDKKGYGFVNPQTPEISMAIQKEYRNKGIGTTLLKEIALAYSQQNITALSLSVDKRNPAIRLYQRAGFEKHGDQGTALTLLRTIFVEK